MMVLLVALDLFCGYKLVGTVVAENVTLVLDAVPKVTTLLISTGVILSHAHFSAHLIPELVVQVGN